MGMMKDVFLNWKWPVMQATISLGWNYYSPHGNPFIHCHLLMAKNITGQLLLILIDIIPLPFIGPYIGLPCLNIYTVFIG